MTDGPENGTSSALTVSEAAHALEGLLSDETSEDTESPEPQAGEQDDPAAPSEAAEAAEAEDPDESTAEEGEEAPDDADEESDEETPEPRAFRVKIDGKDEVVTEDELLKGYSRTADYTRKTQQLAEQRKQFEAEQTAVRTERATYRDRLAELEHNLRAVTPAEPDWDQIRRDHPTEYAALYTDWQRHSSYLSGLRAERETVERQLAEDGQRAYQGHLSTERDKLLTALPAWKDAAVAKREKQELQAFAASNGFAPEEIAGISDHRAILLLRKAMLHDRAGEKRAAVQQKVAVVKVTPPAPARSARPPVSTVTRAKQRLAKTGSVKDAAALIEQLL